MDDFPLPEPPSKDRNILAIELISGSFGGAAQVIVGQVSRDKAAEGSKEGNSMLTVTAAGHAQNCMFGIEVSRTWRYCC